MTSRPRRALLGAVALVLLLLAVAVPDAGASKVYVTNWDSESVSVIDSGTDRALGEPIQVGNSPVAVAITPDGSRAYVANTSSHDVSVIDTTTDRRVGGPVDPVEVGVSPHGIAISPDGSRAYVANYGGNDVSVIDTVSGRLSGGPIAAGRGPMKVALSPDGAVLYVVNANSNPGDVSVIDTATREPLHDPIPVGKYPMAVAVSPDGNRLYVANEESNSVSVIDTATDQPVKSIPVGKSPRGIAITPDGAKLYVANHGSDTVAVIDTATDRPLGEIHLDAGAEPAGLAITPDGAKLYVADEGSESVTVIDTATESVIKTIDGVGSSPARIAIVPDQPPVAALAPATATVGDPLRLDASASSDLDGTIATFDWSFGDGLAALDGGPTPIHTYARPGTYPVTVRLTDDEGCSTQFVFTGQTASCNGSAVAERTVPVRVRARPPAGPPPPPSNEFRIRRLRHNVRRGTVRMRLWLPGAGGVRVHGPRVRPVWRRVHAARGLTLVVRPRRMLNVALKRRRHRARVAVRVTFSPVGGTPRTRVKRMTLRRRGRAGKGRRRVRVRASSLHRHTR